MVPAPPLEKARNAPRSEKEIFVRARALKIQTVQPASTASRLWGNVSPAILSVPRVNRRHATQASFATRAQESVDPLRVFVETAVKMLGVLTIERAERLMETPLVSSVVKRDARRGPHVLMEAVFPTQGSVIRAQECVQEEPLIVSLQKDVAPSVDLPLLAMTVSAAIR